jgi:hypothetical protein
VGAVVTCATRARCNHVATPAVVAVAREALRATMTTTPTGAHAYAPALSEEDAAMLRVLQIERQCLFYGTRDGGIGVIVPAVETMFRRLRTVQDRMQTSVAWPCGLSPASYRYAVQLDHQGEPAHDRGHLLDGDALLQYASLESGVQRDIARRSGTSSRQVCGHLSA